MLEGLGTLEIGKVVVPEPSVSDGVQIVGDIEVVSAAKLERV